MRAVRYHEYGDESVLQLDEVDVPTPEHGEVLVRIHAACVNPFDTYMRKGMVEPHVGLPHIAGMDMAGVVAETGPGVTEFEPDDRVWATALGLTRQGTYAEYTTVPVERLAPLPESVSFRAAAAAAEPFSTALQALVSRGELSFDDVCVVQGAAGGVGHAAVQLARLAGAYVVGTARPGEPADAARRLGAHAVVDYRVDDLAAAITEATNGRPVDVIVETHADANIEADLEMLAPGGRIVLLGESDTIKIPKPVSALGKMANADVQFMSHIASWEGHAHHLERIGVMLGDDTLEAVVAGTYPLSEAGDAQAHCVRPGVVGKVVIDTTPSS